MPNYLHDVFFFDPDEEHAIFHHIVRDFEFLEILDCHTTRLWLDCCFVIIARIASFGILFFLTQNFLFLLFVVSEEIPHFWLLPLWIDVDGFNFFEFLLLHLPFARLAVPHFFLVLPIKSFNLAHFESFWESLGLSLFFFILRLITLDRAWPLRCLLLDTLNTTSWYELTLFKTSLIHSISLRIESKGTFLVHWVLILSLYPLLYRLEVLLRDDA